jgi:hypothetical protein
MEDNTAYTAGWLTGLAIWVSGMIEIAGLVAYYPCINNVTFHFRVFSFLRERKSIIEVGLFLESTYQSKGNE